VDEFELNRDDQMTELDQSMLDPSWVPTRYHQHHIDERENRYDLRPRVPHDPRVENIVPEIINEHENKRLSPYNLRPLPGRRTSEKENI
jgi:hypothetical protein